MGAQGDQDLARESERRAAEARYRSLFEHAPDGILIGDPQSYYLDANPSMCRMLGYTREELVGLHATDIIAARDASRISPVIEDIKGRGHHHEEWEFRRKDGSVFPVEVIATLTPDGNLLGMVRDITERKATEAALRDLNTSLDEKRQQLEEANRALQKDIAARNTADIEIKRANRALAMLGACNEALIRAVEEDALLHSICRIIVDKGGYRAAAVGFPLEDAEGAIALKARAGDLPPHLWNPSGDGIRLPLQLSGRPLGVLALYSTEGAPQGSEEVKLLGELADNLSFGIGSIRHRVEREKAEEALRASLAEKQALLKEVHHRVKNNMQVITSLLRLEANRIDHETTRGVLKHMQNRIQSMAVLHETLYRSGNFTRVDLGSYLKLVSGQLARSLSIGPDRVHLHLDVASAGVDLDQAIPCGLIVNELVTNAFKHGFPKGRSGEVWIELQQSGETGLRLRVRDNGVGLPNDLEGAREKSLGLRLVSDLVRQLRGTLVVGPGSSFEVTFATEHKAP